MIKSDHLLILYKKFLNTKLHPSPSFLKIFVYLFYKLVNFPSSLMKTPPRSFFRNSKEGLRKFKLLKQCIQPFLSLQNEMS